MTKVDEGAELLEALRHQLRREILRTMFGRPRISPSEIAEILRKPLSGIGYHVRVLANRGVIELVEEVQMRGTMQHFYRLNIDEPWARSLLGLDG